MKHEFGLPMLGAVCRSATVPSMLHLFQGLRQGLCRGCCKPWMLLVAGC
jgi:hypothetical protein